MFRNVAWGVEEDEDTVHSSVMAELGFTFSERAKRLRPTFVCVDLPIGVKAYYRQAMSAWVRGLDHAALILCWSVLDGIIRQRLSPQLTSGTFKSFESFSNTGEPDIIDHAKKAGVLNSEMAKSAKRIRKQRNDILHERDPVSSDDCFQALTQTKAILEAVFSR